MSYIESNDVNDASKSSLRGGDSSCSSSMTRLSRWGAVPLAIRVTVERLPFAVAHIDLGVAASVEVDRADGRVVEPALRPLVGTLHEGLLWFAAVGDRCGGGEVAAGVSRP